MEYHKLEEYFEDLGLQYDTDYIDASKAKASGKRLKSDSYDSPRVEEEKEDEIPSILVLVVNFSFFATTPLLNKEKQRCGS